MTNQRLSKILATLGLCASLSGSLWAFEGTPCSNQDLRANPVLGTVRNQGSLGWCFAYAAADIYSVALNQRVSPFDIAVNYYREYRGYGSPQLSKLSRWAGGRQDFVYDSVQKWGICPDNIFSAYRSDASAKLQRLEEMAIALKDLRGESRHSEATRLVNASYPSLYYVFPQTSSAQLRNALVEMSPHEPQPLIALADQICSDKRIQVPALQRSSLTRTTRARALGFINNSLSRGRPVAMAYNTAFLREPIQPKPEELRVNHISSIVASRKVGDKCEYLLRNSWGPFNPSAHHPLLRTWSEGNYLWLPEDILYPMAIELHGVRRK